MPSGPRCGSEVALGRGLGELVAVVPVPQGKVLGGAAAAALEVVGARARGAGAAPQPVPAAAHQLVLLAGAAGAVAGTRRVAVRLLVLLRQVLPQLPPLPPLQQLCLHLWAAAVSMAPRPPAARARAVLLTSLLTKQ